MDLEGKVAIITGGGRGIGRATALKLAPDGVRVAVVSRSADELEEVVEAVEALEGQALACPTDVTAKASVEAARSGVHHYKERLRGVWRHAGPACRVPTC